MASISPTKDSPRRGADFGVVFSGADAIVMTLLVLRLPGVSIAGLASPDCVNSVYKCSPKIV